MAGDDWFGEEEVEVAVQVVGFLAGAAAAAEDEVAEVAAGSEDEAAVVAAEADRRYTCPVQRFRANQVWCENDQPGARVAGKREFGRAGQAGMGGGRSPSRVPRKTRTTTDKRFFARRKPFIKTKDLPTILAPLDVSVQSGTKITCQVSLCKEQQLYHFLTVLIITV